MATYINGIKSLSAGTRPVIILMNLMNLISASMCYTISITCPSLHEGSITVFTCSIPTSMCSHDKVFFDFQRNNEVPSRLCLYSATGTCDQPPVGGMNCSCVSSNSSIREYQFNFLGDKDTYQGGTLKCNVDCEREPRGGICQSISFEQIISSSSKPTENTTDYTPPFPANETDGSDHEPSSCSTPCIIGLSVGIPCGFAVGTGILLGVLLKTGKISLFRPC